MSHTRRVRKNAISDERVRYCALSTHSVFRPLCFKLHRKQRLRLAFDQTWHRSETTPPDEPRQRSQRVVTSAQDRSDLCRRPRPAAPPEARASLMPPPSAGRQLREPERRVHRVDVDAQVGSGGEPFAAGGADGLASMPGEMLVPALTGGEDSLTAGHRTHQATCNRAGRRGLGSVGDTIYIFF